jgi:hypothetical protein
MRPKLSQTAVTLTFVPFAILLSAALLAAEQSEALDHARLVYASWVSLAFATPALALFVFPRTRTSAYALLTWTFSLAAYLVHFYYAFGVTYHGSIAATYAGQGPIIATSNFTLTALWIVDVVTSWTIRRELRWLAALRLVARGLVLVTFVVSAVVIFDGFVRVLGSAMIVVIASCIAIRVIEFVRHRGGAPRSVLSSDAAAS